ncbi:NAD(P)-binding oxidoreductase [Lapillicoccus sp.]|uniref:NAD(P)-dependent oxidoreductase n=1 Tax=Lapillicoccus sp. TaxID=1909287 RepID=UPI0025D5FB6D|nr:NAD(P)-binding oxidoreductase [Lapillicoccus sp.]
MKLLVLGGTGPTGALVIGQALTAGDTVRALVRSPEKVGASNPHLEVVTGQATEPADVTRTLDGIDAVIVTLGATKGSITDATRALLAGAAQHPSIRVVVLSSFAVLRDRLSAPAKLMTGMAMGAIITDKTNAEQLLRDSDLNYTLVYATRLTNDPTTGGATVVADKETLRLSHTISRATVAAFLLAQARDTHPADKVVTITG